jgi:putative DNA primase/helicase
MGEYMKFLGVAEDEWIELQVLDPREPANLGLRRGAAVAYARGIEDVAHRLHEVDDRALGIEPVGAYIIPNKIAPGVEARGLRGRWANFEHGTADKDITARRAFYVDCDPVRTSGVQANAAECKASFELYRLVCNRLVEVIGEPAIGLGFSGSGMQIHLALANLPNDAEVGGVIKSILVALDITFSNAGAKIDTSVSDPKRLAPAWGTVKRKGANGHADRPWRPTGFACPDDVQRLTLADLRRLLGALREALPADKQAEVDKALGLKAASSSSPTTRGTGEPKKSDTFERCNAVPIRAVAERLHLDVNKPTCPWCGATSKVDFLDKKGMNILKCQHATCGQKAAGPVRLVSKVAYNCDELKGNKQAIRDVLGWFREHYGIEPSTRGSQQQPAPVPAAPVTDTTSAGSSTSTSTPNIQINVDTYRVVDEAVAALARDPDIYSRGSRLVTVIEEAEHVGSATRTPRGPVPTPIAPSVLGAVYLSRRATWEAWSPQARGYVPATPPSTVTAAVHDLRLWKGIRVLVSVTETPVMRRDGSVLDAPGYDQATGLLYRPSSAYEPVPESPTRTDAEAERDALLEVLCDMPIDAAGKATWLAMLITYFARPMFDGPSPFFLVDSNAPGAAKTLCVEANSRICTGRAPARIQYTDDQDELEKRITSVLIKGYPIRLFDNIEDGGTIGGPKLEDLATSDIWGGRLLGASEQVDVPNRGVTAFTGNNPVVKGAMLRRVLHMRFETALERPEDRTDFKHPDLLGWIVEVRPTLVKAALTILRAWVVAGRPKIGVTLGSYPGWCGTVGEAVAWITGIDVTTTRKALASREGSGDVHLLRPLLRAWTRVFATREVYVVDVLKLVRDEDARVATERRKSEKCGDDPADVVHAYDDLRDALRAFAPQAKGTLPTPSYLGRRLGSVLRRVVDGARFDRRVDRDDVGLWRVDDHCGGCAGAAAGAKSAGQPPHIPVEENRGQSPTSGAAGARIRPLSDSAIDDVLAAFEDGAVGTVNTTNRTAGPPDARGADRAPATPADAQRIEKMAVECAGAESERQPPHVPRTSRTGRRRALREASARSFRVVARSGLTAARVAERGEVGA